MSSDSLADKLAALWTTVYHDRIACGLSDAQADKAATEAVNRARAARR